MYKVIHHRAYCDTTHFSSTSVPTYNVKINQFPIYNLKQDCLEILQKILFGADKRVFIILIFHLLLFLHKKKISISYLFRYTNFTTPNISYKRMEYKF